MYGMLSIILYLDFHFWQVCDVPLELVPTPVPYIAKSLQLTVQSMYGYMAGIQYFDIQGNLFK
jgi:hypothetical protein